MFYYIGFPIIKDTAADYKGKNQKNTGRSAPGSGPTAPDDPEDIRFERVPVQHFLVCPGRNMAQGGS